MPQQKSVLFHKWLFSNPSEMNFKMSSGGPRSIFGSAVAQVSENGTWSSTVPFFSQFLDPLFKLPCQGLAYCVLNVLLHPQNIDYGAFLSMKCEGYWVKQDVTTGKYFLTLKLHNTLCLTLAVQKKTVSDSRLEETNL